MSDTLTGGCQCGACRFVVTGPLGRASICHCRMCQRAFGGPFGPLATASGLAWTRGAPTYFRSSNRVRRGFCSACGTPLTFEPDLGPPEVAIGALDDPTAAVPVIQHSVETRLAWVVEIGGLPTRNAEETAKLAPYFASIRSRQHPDHDTSVWPVGGA
ncbi:MAG TPA: GFA family protein [Caulobacteraceae bacterium]|nr:GFA family protein [Caulobacteraceae bacterium]